LVALTVVQFRYVEKKVQCVPMNLDLLTLAPQRISASGNAGGSAMVEKRGFNGVLPMS
jgi:hypothetical protein